MAFTLYVSPDGCDDWTGLVAEPNAGRTDGPVATLAKARDAVRALKDWGDLYAPVTVLVRGGNYSLSKTLVFGPEDSGSAACPITYAAYPGEAPVIRGGRAVDLDWRRYQGEILVAELPEARRGREFHHISIDGKRQTRARLPREGYYYMEEPVGEAAFSYREGDLERYANLGDVEVVVLHSWDESRLRVAEIDEDARVVRFTGAPEPSHPFGWAGSHPPNRYYVEGALEGVQAPGDWCLDRAAGKVYCWPEEGVDLDEAEVVIPELDGLVRFAGEAEGEPATWVEHLCFEGLTFAETDWSLPEEGYPGCGDVGDIIEPSMLYLDGARNCAFRNCCFKNSGTYAFEIAGTGNAVIGCEVYDTGSGGIISRNLGVEQNVITYNHVHHCGRAYLSAVGINIDDGGGLVAHNLIHDIPHSGIYARHWASDHQPRERRNQQQELVIAYNEIYDISAPINDTGGLFVRDANMRIENNLIHDVYSDGEGTPGWGIYMGCESRESVVRNNLVYRSRESLHLLWANRDLLFENNIFVDGLKTQMKSDNWPEFRHERITMRRNIWCWSNPEASFARFQSEDAMLEASDENLFFCSSCETMRITGLDNTPDLAAWQARGFDTHSVVADPCFVDPAADNYDLRADSPARALGIKSIDISTVGLRGSAWDPNKA